MASTGTDSANLSRRKRVAVVGSGIAGLTVCYTLTHNQSDERFDVTVFERSPQLGMDASAVDIDHENGVTTRVDVPLRVFSEYYYPNLCALYRDIGVEFRPENFSGSFITARRDDAFVGGSTLFKYQNFLLPLTGISVPLLFPTSLHSVRLTMECIRFFFRRIPQDALAAQQLVQSVRSGAPLVHSTLGSSAPFVPKGDGIRKGESFGDYLARGNYSKDFAENMVLIIVAGMLTCSVESARAYPAEIVVSYLASRSMGGVRRAINGTQEVVERLASKVDRCFLNNGASAIFPAVGDKKAVVVDSNGHSEEFDIVIVATQANQAARLLASHPGTEFPADVQELHDTLKSFSYEEQEVVNHSDLRLMPPRRAEWRSVNFIVKEGACTPMASIWLNAATGCGQTPSPLIQTWNPLFEINPDLVHSRSRFQRPIMGPTASTLTQNLSRLQGAGSLYIVGSYVLYGMPLLENGVNSALEVCGRLGAAPPFPVQDAIVLRRRPVSKGKVLFGVAILGALAAEYFTQGEWRQQVVRFVRSTRNTLF